MNRCLATLLLLAALPALAGLEYDGYGTTNDPRGATALRVRADVLAAPLTLRADKRDLAERVQSLGAARSTLVNALGRLKGAELLAGNVQAPFTRGGKLSSLAGGSPAEWRLTLYVPLPESSDTFTAMAAASKWLESQKMPDGVELSVGTFTPTVRDPQKYRPQLLRLIAEDVARLREAIPGALPVHIGGLENAVVARPADEREVLLSLAYTLSIEKR